MAHDGNMPNQLIDYRGQLLDISGNLTDDEDCCCGEPPIDCRCLDPDNLTSYIPSLETTIRFEQYGHPTNWAHPNPAAISFGFATLYQWTGIGSLMNFTKVGSRLETPCSVPPTESTHGFATLRIEHNTIGSGSHWMEGDFELYSRFDTSYHAPIGSPYYGEYDIITLVTLLQLITTRYSPGNPLSNIYAFGIAYPGLCNNQTAHWCEYLDPIYGAPETETSCEVYSGYPTYQQWFRF